jgi:hypothetical protein
MLNLSSNVVLLRVAQQVRADVDDMTERRVRQIVDALRKRRERLWNKALGRRSDGRAIRPIRRDGKRFVFGPVLTQSQRVLLVARVRAAVVASPECESCGADHARAAFVYNPGTRTEYWPATLCSTCERSLNSPAVQRDILTQEIERCERRAGWSASA